MAAVAPADVGKVVVGSRAEAKAVRKAAEQAAKQASKQAGKAAAKPVTLVVAADGAETAAAVAARADRTTRAATRSVAPSPKVVAARAAAVPRPDAGSAHWTWVDAVLVLAVLSLTVIGKDAVMAIPSIALMPTFGRAMTRAAVLAAYYAIQISAFVFLAGRHSVRLWPAFGLSRPDIEGADEDADHERPSAIASAGLVLGLLVAVEAVAIGYGLVMQALNVVEPTAVASDVASAFGGGQAGLVLSAVLVALVAPLAEEMAFRGVILSALGNRLGMWPAIGISAVLFAGYHLSAWLFFPMLVFGVALGWLTWSRQSLWPAIVLHVMFNGLAVAAAFLVPR
jgi:membrane protease YdiL (CAAX protease family)